MRLQVFRGRKRVKTNCAKFKKKYGKICKACVGGKDKTLQKIISKRKKQGPLYQKLYMDCAKRCKEEVSKEVKRHDAAHKIGSLFRRRRYEVRKAGRTIAGSKITNKARAFLLGRKTRRLKKPPLPEWARTGNWPAKYYETGNVAVRRRRRSKSRSSGKRRSRRIPYNYTKLAIVRNTDQGEDDFGLLSDDV
jgi:hypothetical protein